jgi:hypothetical protein
VGYIPGKAWEEHTACEGKAFEECESLRYSAKKLCALCGKKNKSFFNYCCWFGEPMISVVRHIAK